jgi:hypothetical protein
MLISQTRHSSMSPTLANLLPSKLRIQEIARFQMQF